MSGIRKTLCLALGAVLLAMAAGRRAGAQKKHAGGGAQPGPRHPRPDPVPHLRRADHLLADVREALRDRREPEHPAPQLAAALPAVSDGGKTVTIKLRTGVKFNDGTAVQRRGDEALARPAPRDEGLQPPQRAGVGHRGRGRRPAHRPPAAQGAVLAAHRAAGRPGRHADLAGGRQEARRQVRHRAGVRGPVAVRRARAARPDRGRALVRTTSIQSAAKFDRIVFRIIPDDNVRLANLRSGDIDVMHAVAPTDASSLKKEGRFEVSSVTGLGFNSISINLHNKTGKTNPPGDLGTPLANDPRVREALELSIDREALNQVAYDGQNTVGCGPISPNSVFFDKTRKCPARDVARAKKLLADAGWPAATSSRWSSSTIRQQRRVGEVIQGMARDAGLRHQPAAAGVRLLAQGQRRRQAPGVPDRLERARGPRRQHPPGPGVRRQPQRHAGLRREDRRAAEQGARDQRHRPAAGALPRGHRPDRRPGGTRSTSITRTTSWRSPRT